MNELRNYPEPTGPQPPLIDSMQVSWWNGEVPDDNAQRPVSVEYTPVLYFPQLSAGCDQLRLAGNSCPVDGPLPPSRVRNIRGIIRHGEAGGLTSANSALPLMNRDRCGY
jgi:hypothetical protein